MHDTPDCSPIYRKAIQGRPVRLTRQGKIWESSKPERSWVNDFQLSQLWSPLSYTQWEPLQQYETRYLRKDRVAVAVKCPFLLEWCVVYRQFPVCRSHPGKHQFLFAKQCCLLPKNKGCSYQSVWSLLRFKCKNICKKKTYCTVLLILKISSICLLDKSFHKTSFSVSISVAYTSHVLTGTVLW